MPILLTTWSHISRETYQNVVSMIKTNDRVKIVERNQPHLCPTLDDNILFLCGHDRVNIVKKYWTRHHKPSCLNMKNYQHIMILEL